MEYIPLEDAWESLLEVTKNCQVTPTVFESIAKQKYAHRYRILVKGAGTLALSRLPFVNIYATIPSSPMEIFDHFDIEAVQSYCYSELVINAGQNVGNRHLGLLADTLTYMGVPIKMDIEGKKASEGGVLATASFQQAFDVMIDASAANLSDDIRSNVTMTLVGDFTRSERAQEINEDPRLDSTIDRLMSASLFESRTGKTAELPKQRRRRKPEVQQAPQIPVPQNLEFDLVQAAADIQDEIF